VSDKVTKIRVADFVFVMWVHSVVLNCGFVCTVTTSRVVWRKSFRHRCDDADVVRMTTGFWRACLRSWRTTTLQTRHDAISRCSSKNFARSHRLSHSRAKMASSRYNLLDARPFLWLVKLRGMPHCLCWWNKNVESQWRRDEFSKIAGMNARLILSRVKFWTMIKHLVLTVSAIIC